MCLFNIYKHRRSKLTIFQTNCSTTQQNPFRLQRRCLGKQVVSVLVVAVVVARRRYCSPPRTPRSSRAGARGAVGRRAADRERRRGASAGTGSARRFVRPAARRRPNPTAPRPPDPRRAPGAGDVYSCLVNVPRGVTRARILGAGLWGS